MAINVLPKTKTPKGEHAMRTRRVLYPETSEMYICELVVRFKKCNAYPVVS